MYSANSRHERLLNLIRKKTKESNDPFIITDLCGDCGVIPGIHQEKQRPKPMSLAELFHLKRGV